MSAVVSFARATPKDAVAIADVHDAAWQATYRGLIPHLHLERMVNRRGPRWWQRQLMDGAAVTLLKFNGVPQGYASWGRARGPWPWNAGEIFELYMTPEFQGVGLGGKLFRTVRQLLHGEGLDRMVVWALEDNDLACAFYGNLGGTVAATAMERYGDTELKRIAYVWGVNVTSNRD